MDILTRFLAEKDGFLMYSAVTKESQPTKYEVVLIQKSNRWQVTLTYLELLELLEKLSSADLTQESSCLSMTQSWHLLRLNV